MGKDKADDASGFSRRRFLQVSRNAAVGTLVAGSLPGLTWLNSAVAAVPVSEGYLLIDAMKCQGCMTCMLACSLVHEGRESLSLARIQVIQTPFEHFPEDISLVQCRQCEEPACLEVCPTGALHVDRENGNVRRIDAEECVGCQLCIRACNHPPGRAIWGPEDELARKCDLCVETPHWDRAGGPSGVQACIEVCPVGALKFTSTLPEQEGDEGYRTNLRGAGWKKFGLMPKSEDPEAAKAPRGFGPLAWRLPYAGRWEDRSDLDAPGSAGEESTR